VKNKRLVTTGQAGGEKTGAHLNGMPDECPRCHTKVSPRALSAVVFPEDDEQQIEEGYQCTSHECGKMFIGVYRAGDIGQTQGEFYFFKSIPRDPRPPVVSGLVAEVSPTFVETYGQALDSEGYGLTQLTGIGLRKALEFLVKDFAIKQHPDRKQKIIEKPLGTCIQDYLKDPYLKAAAERATWLGNDETHYVRKWKDQDINDLKDLIRLAMNWMENVLLTKKYVAEMPPKPKKGP
jgi:hypothetical protein